MRRLFTPLLLASLLASTSPAPAEPSSATAAAELKRAGDEAMNKLRYGDALEAYTRAYSATRDPALLYNRGRAYEGLGDFPAALDQLEAFDREAPAALKARVKKLAELVASVRARVTTLKVTTTQPGAKVLVRDKVVGTTPCAVKLSSGRATLEVTAEGFSPYRQEIELPGGGELAVDVPLVRKDTQGVLSVRTTPSGASVLLDGQPSGTTPMETRREAGEVRVRLEREGYLPAEASAVIDAGGRQELDVALEAKPGITSKWWFWTALGVVVIGGTVTTVALLTEKKAPHGDIAPGQVSAPLIRF